MKNTITIIIIIAFLISTQDLTAQTGGPGPATGAPIDGLSGLLMMAAAAIFGKKYLNKDKH